MLHHIFFEHPVWDVILPCLAPKCEVSARTFSSQAWRCKMAWPATSDMPRRPCVAAAAKGSYSKNLHYDVRSLHSIIYAASCHWGYWLILLAWMRDPRIHRCMVLPTAMFILDLQLMKFELDKPYFLASLFAFVQLYFYVHYWSLNFRTFSIVSFVLTF